MNLPLPNIKWDDYVAIDTETYDPGLKEYGSGMGLLRESHILGVSFCVKRDGKYIDWYVPLNHTEGVNCDWDKFYAWCENSLRPDKCYIGANILYDLCFMRTSGFWFPDQRGIERYFDVLSMEALLSETARISLEVAAKLRLDESKDERRLKDWALKIDPQYESKGKAAIELARWMPPEAVDEYARADARCAYKLFEVQVDLLQKRGLWKVAVLENQLLPVLLAMRLQGVRVDEKRAPLIKQKLEGRLREVQERLGGVNPNSSEVVGIIAKSLGLYVPISKNGKPSVRKEWLEEHLNTPFIKDVYDARILGKAISTYINGIFDNHVHGGIIYPNFHALPRHGGNGTETGRFSASNPNLQAIPARNKITTKLIRGLFLPFVSEDEPEDYFTWVKADYSQIEYRLLAHYALGAGSEEVRQRYAKDPNSDFHDACRVMIEENTGVKIERQPAKTLNFGMVYGMGAKKLTEMLHTTPTDAKHMLNAYHSAMPYIKATANSMAREASRVGCIRTLSGRIRHFNMWEACRNRDLFPPMADRSAAKELAGRHGDSVQRAFTHKALNTKLQGGAADIIKIAMVALNKAGFNGQYGPPLLTVHDELDYSLPNPKYDDSRRREGERALENLKDIMENCIELKVPLVCDVQHGPNWGAVK